MRFVIQEHKSRTHHFDLRLERDGVYKSWAVPKGVPEETGIRRLAVQVEDHDLAFGDFEGDIPEGQYGAGTVSIWDRGEYVRRVWTDERIEVTIYGCRITGDYALVRFRRAGDREWLIHKRRS